jgi:hypothetical protein
MQSVTLVSWLVMRALDPRIGADVRLDNAPRWIDPARRPHGLPDQVRQ